MELLFEIIFELIFEGSVEIAKSRKISKWIRYPIIALLLVFFILVLGLIGFVGISMLLSDMKYSVYGGILFILIDIVLTISSIKKITKEIKLRKSNR